jgi:hypothetical protein
MGRNLTIEFILDQREEDFDCEILRLRDGQRRDEYDWNFQDAEGMQVRESLFTLASSRAGSQQLFHKPGGLPFKQKVSIWLGDYEHMLRVYGQDILKDSPDGMADRV